MAAKKPVRKKSASTRIVRTNRRTSQKRRTARAPAPQSASSRSRSAAKRKPNRKWVAKVKTVSTFPPRGLFTKDAETIARSLASKKVSPKGPGSGMRMLTYFINRGGRGLSASRKAELQRAKKLLSERVQQARESKKKVA